MHTVITGANRGIGLALTKEFLKAGHQVTAVCRNLSDDLQNLDTKIISSIDFSMDKDIKNLYHQIDIPIDILIHNAGIFLNESVESMVDGHFETIEKQMQVDFLSPLKVSMALLPKMKEDSILGLMTSKMGSIEDNRSGQYYGYRCSRAALNAAGRSLSIDLQEKKIWVVMLHPGYVKTDMTNFNGLITPEQSAQGLIKQILNTNFENTGRFVGYNGEIIPW